jgi:hypothetical protein
VIAFNEMRTGELTLSIALLGLAFCSLFSPGADSADLTAIKAKLAPELASFNAANAQYQKSRWAQTPKATVFQPAGITKEDLHECNVALQALLTEIDRMLLAFEKSGMLLPDGEAEHWRVKRRICSLFQNQIGLLEENWNDWHVEGLQPKTGKPEMWQTVVSLNQRDIDKEEKILLEHHHEQSALLR